MDSVNNIRDILKALGENRTQQVQSSLSAFHTMLGIGGIQTRYRQDEYSVASEKYHPVKLLYLDDHDKAIPQEDAKFLRLNSKRKRLSCAKYMKRVFVNINYLRKLFVVSIICCIFAPGFR